MYDLLLNSNVFQYRTLEMASSTLSKRQHDCTDYRLQSGLDIRRANSRDIAFTLGHVFEIHLHAIPRTVSLILEDPHDCGV